MAPRRRKNCSTPPIRLPSCAETVASHQSAVVSPSRQSQSSVSDAELPEQLNLAGVVHVVRCDAADVEPPSLTPVHALAPRGLGQLRHGRTETRVFVLQKPHVLAPASRRGAREKLLAGQRKRLAGLRQSPADGVFPVRSVNDELRDIVAPSSRAPK